MSLGTKLDKKERSWVLYDCANSAYSMAITTALFPAYLGMFTDGSSMTIGFFNTLASVIIAILSPILGTIADYKGFKKRFFMFFFLLGVIFTGVLAVVPKGQWLMLLIIYVVTAVGFAGANIFYDSFLVDITSDDRMDSVSTKGFAFGYIFSVIPFGISLGIILMMGTDSLVGYQIGFVITALWWGLLTIPMIRNVKQVHYIEREPRPIAMSFKRLGKTFKEIRKHKVVWVFLIGYFFYIDGVGTIIKMAVPYSQETLNLVPDDITILLGILLIIQIIAFPCAIIYGRLAKKYSAKKLIIFAICTYIFATLFAFIMTELWHVFILGGLIGSAQGGIQVLSRSYYAKIIPKKNSNEFFGFYNIFGKFAAILGPTFMALFALWFDARYSILTLILFFVIGLVIVFKLPEQSGRIEAL